MATPRMVKFIQQDPKKQNTLHSGGYTKNLDKAPKKKFVYTPAVSTHLRREQLRAKYKVVSPRQRWGEHMRHTEWNNKIALDLALVLESGLGTVEELLESNRLKQGDLEEFAHDKNFLRVVEDYREDIRDKGLAFKLKARVQAEELLRTSYIMTQDPDVPASVKADLIKSTVKWAGYDTPPPVQGATATGGVSVTINFSGESGKEQMVNITPQSQAVGYSDDEE